MASPNLPFLTPAPPAYPFPVIAVRRSQQDLVPDPRKRLLKVDDAILRNFAKRKIRSRRKNAAKYDRKRRTLLTQLPPEILRMIYDKLDIPSRVTLSLTSKFFLEMSKRVDTGVTDLPSPVRMHADCKHVACVYTNHLSSRRILLLMLKSWMPHGYTLCWVCLRYTPTSASVWRTTNQVNLKGPNRIRLEALDALNLTKVKCHKHCLPPLNWLDGWSFRRIGAGGGFSDQYWRLHEPYLKTECNIKIEYDAGAKCEHHDTAYLQGGPHACSTTQ